MKLKVYVSDLEIPRTQKRATLAAIVCVALIIAGGVAFAAPKHTFQPQETLTAANLNLNFNDLDSRLVAIEKPIGLRYRVGGAATLSNDQAFHTINFDDPDYDYTNNAVTTGTNWQFVARSGGRYLVAFHGAGGCGGCGTPRSSDEVSG